MKISNETRQAAMDHLRSSMERENLFNSHTAKYLNLNPIYISMALNPKSWDHIGIKAWTRIIEWHKQRETKLSEFKIPEGEPIFTKKETFKPVPFPEPTDQLGKKIRAAEKNKQKFNAVLKKSKEKIKSPVPPLGLRPRWLVDEQRILEIKDAADRYIDAKKSIPPEWIEEYNEIVVRLEKRKNQRTNT